MDSINKEMEKALDQIEQAKMVQDALDIADAKTALEDWLKTLPIEKLRGLYKIASANAIIEYIKIAGKEKANAETNANTLQK